MPDLNLDTIALLAHRGARQETLIALLRPHLPRLGLTEIERVLTAIGEPYAELTVVGDRHHVLVANTPAVIDLLEHLARLGTVSSYTSTQEDTRLRVHRRLE